VKDSSKAFNSRTTKLPMTTRVQLLSTEAFRASDMPCAPLPLGRDTRRALCLTDYKDPPRGSRRRTSTPLDDTQAAVLATRKPQASAVHQAFDKQFTRHFSSHQRDEEYCSLLKDCRQVRLVLQMNHSLAYTFLEVLTTALCNGQVQV
jgi:hypothetical protein